MNTVSRALSGCVTVALAIGCASDRQPESRVAPTSSAATQTAPDTGPASTAQFHPVRLGMSLDEVRAHLTLGEKDKILWMTGPSSMCELGYDVQLKNGIECGFAFDRHLKVFLVSTRSANYTIKGHRVIGATRKQLREWFPRCTKEVDVQGYAVYVEVEPNVYCGFFDEDDPAKITEDSRVKWVEWIANVHHRGP